MPIAIHKGFWRYLFNGNPDEFNANYREIFGEKKFTKPGKTRYVVRDGKTIEVDKRGNPINQSGTDGVSDDSNKTS